MQHSQARFRLAVVSLALLVVGAFAAVVPIAPKPPQVADDWVRTVDGWQRATWRADSSIEPALHPLIPALELALVSILCLVAFPCSVKPIDGSGSFPSPVERPIGRPHAWQHRAESDCQQRSA
jgi:hypothetical protein